MPATYTHFQYLDRDVNFFKTRKGIIVCSSLGLASLIPCTFKRLPIKKDKIMANENNIFYDIDIALRSDLARSSSG